MNTHVNYIQPFVGLSEYLSPLKFRLPLIFAPFNFRPFNFRHPLLKISLPLIFATLWKFEIVSIYLKLSNWSLFVTKNNLY